MPPSAPPPFENEYKRGQIKTVKDCWTCRKSTYVCLMTSNYTTPSGDFFYTCEAHLKDRNFASPILPEPSKAASPSTPTVSQSEIDQAVKEYKERQRAKDEKEKSKEGGEEGKRQSTPVASPPSKASSPSTTTGDALPTPPTDPQKFRLHPSFFSMRLRLHHQKSMLKEAQSRTAQLALPATPTSRPSAPKA